MIFDDIEQLKLNWTDKYVVVDASRAELLRFKGMTGTVKTVNMSGRALVQFDANNNIGWYDIDPKFLTKIDAPLPKPEAKAEKKAAPAKSEKPAEKAPAAGGAAKMSVAEMMAAARAKGGGAAAPAAKPAAEKPAAAADPKKMSLAEMMAAARANKPAAAPAAKKEEAPAAAPPPPAPKVEAAPEPPPAPVAAPKAAKGALPKDVAGITAYCRKTDGKA